MFQAAANKLKDRVVQSLPIVDRQERARAVFYRRQFWQSLSKLFAESVAAGETVLAGSSAKQSKDAIDAAEKEAVFSPYVAHLAWIRSSKYFRQV